MFTQPGEAPYSNAKTAWRDNDEVVIEHPLDELATNPKRAWCDPGPGLIHDIASWTMATSRWPNWPLAVAAATSTISAVAANNWFSPTRAALTLYLVMLGSTGSGKDKALKSPARILKKIDMAAHARSGKFHTASGLLKLLFVQPVCLGTCDEIAGMLFKRMNAQRADANSAQLRDILCSAWSMSADDEELQPFNMALEIAEDIKWPAYTMLGASTKEDFFSGFSALNITDGLLNRLLLVIGSSGAKANLGSENPPPLPQNIIAGLAALRAAPEGASKAQIMGGPMFKPWQRIVPWGSVAAQRLFSDAERDTRALADGAAGDPIYCLIARLPEYAIRLATLHAMARDPIEPRVTEDDLDWGFALSISSSKLLMDGAEHNMAENGYGRDQNDVFNRIRGAGEAGIAERNLKRSFKRFEPTYLSKLTGHLHALGKIKIVTMKNSRGSGPLRTMYFAEGLVPEMEVDD